MTYLTEKENNGFQDSFKNTKGVSKKENAMAKAK